MAINRSRCYVCNNKVENNKTKLKNKKYDTNKK
jgi:hypothetical protein